MSIFWTDDIRILFKNDKIFEIFPSKNYDMNRKLNSLVRLSIYYSAIIYIYNRNSKVLILPIIVMGISYFIYKRRGNQIVYNNPLEEIISEYDKNTKCRVPTKNNPFMNNKLTDYGRVTKDKACPSYNNVGVQHRIEELYNQGVYRDFKDVFNKNTGERQFYTMPNTSVPNDQEGFSKWLYGKPRTCKEGNSVACLSGLGVGGTGPG